MMGDPPKTAQKQKKIRKLFSPQEDAILTKIMYQQPFETWIAVAEHLPGRTARQCRDRWVNYLSPSNKNGPWTSEEDQLLTEKYMEHGPQWTTIAKFFDGRSENNVKNRWYTYVKNRFQQNQTKVHSFTPTPTKPDRGIRQPIYSATPVPMQMMPPIASTLTPQSAPTYPTQPQKALLPPITEFDPNIPRQSTIAQFTRLSSTPRFKSESVQPFSIYSIH